MDEKQTTPDVKTDVESGVERLVGGLKDIFGGLVKPAAPTEEQKGIQAQASKDSFKLRYAGGEEREVFSDEAGEDMPTVSEAFTEYASDLGLDPSRDCTYRDGPDVCDGAAACEWGHTYIASIARAVKGV